MRMLVTGASGAVGPRVVDALCEAGHTVRTFSMDRLHDGRQTTDDERQTTDDRRQTTDDGRQMTDDGRQTTHDERQTTDDG